MAAAVRSENQFCCSICLECFNKPVTTPCGHNFCKPCLTQHWEHVQHWDISAPCRCPLCKEVFHIKPELKVNTLLSEMVSQFKQETKRRSGQVSKPGEVSCDVCTEPKLKALKSCLVCLCSYCETHLQPHLSISGLKRHELMEPVENLEDRMCPQHNKPLELFCRTDQSCICTMCALLEHQPHKFVFLKEESDQRRSSLQQTQAETQHMVEQRRLKIQEIQRSVQLSQEAADRETAAGNQAFTSLIQSVKRRQDQFIQGVQEKQRQTQKQAQDLLQELQQEICELEKRSTEAKQLSCSEDHLYFVQCCTALRSAAALKDWSSVRLEPETFAGRAARALSGLKDTLIEEFKKVFKVELKTLQQFAVDLTLDPDSAHAYLSLSDDLKQVHHTDERKFPDSPQRFSWLSVFTKQSFSSGRFYFEVQVKEKTLWSLGVAKESVERNKTRGLSYVRGYWCINKCTNGYFAYTDPPVPLSLKCSPQNVGVFVDYSEGLVSFYDADTTDLIYSFTRCCFKEKLFPILNPNNNSNGNNSAPLILTAVKK